MIIPTRYLSFKGFFEALIAGLSIVIYTSLSHTFTCSLPTHGLLMYRRERILFLLFRRLVYVDLRETMVAQRTKPNKHVGWMIQPTHSWLWFIEFNILIDENRLCLWHRPIDDQLAIGKFLKLSSNCLFLVGCGTLCAYVLTVEFVGKRHRHAAGTALWFFWPTSLMMMALLAYLIRDWRTLNIVGAAPGLLQIFLWW